MCVCVWVCVCVGVGVCVCVCVLEVIAAISYPIYPYLYYFGSGLC